MKTHNDSLCGDQLTAHQTAHQAARAVGVSYGSFIYHLRQGHIKYMLARDGRTYLVQPVEARRFAAWFYEKQRLNKEDPLEWRERSEPDGGEPASLDQLLTAHQAAKFVGIKVSTFNYHLRAGHIAYQLSPDGRTHFVTKGEAERFASQLAAFKARHNFSG